MFIILSPSQLRPASFDMRQFKPVALFTQPLYSYAACLASCRLSLVHLIPQQHTIKDEAWLGTPLTLPPGFEPSPNQYLPVGMGDANHCNHSANITGGKRKTLTIQTIISNIRLISSVMLGILSTQFLSKQYTTVQF